MDDSTNADPIPKFTVGTKSNTGIESRHDMMIAHAIAKFFKLLSANRITTAVSNPPIANIPTTSHVLTQNP